MSIRFALLGLLKEQPDHGYRLKSRFEQKTGRVWQLNLGQVYQTLHALECEGLINRVDDEVEPGDDDSLHVRRRYELTNKGRATLQSWTRKRPSTPRPLRDELLIQLLILAEGRREAAIDAIDAQERIYRRHLARLLVRKRKLASQKDATSLMAAVGVEAALLQTGAYLKWLEYCRATFTSTDEPPRNNE